MCHDASRRYPVPPRSPLVVVLSLTLLALAVAPAVAAAQGFRIVNTTLPPAVRSIPYAHALVAAGAAGTVSWHVTSGSFTDDVGTAGTPCEGLALGAASGVLAGTPATSGTCAFTVVASDGVATAEWHGSVRVNRQLVFVSVWYGIAAIDGETNTTFPDFLQYLEYQPMQVLPSRDGRTVFSLGATGVDAIDIETVNIRATVELAHEPAGLLDAALSPDGRRLYVTDWSSSALHVIDTASMTEVKPAIALTWGEAGEAGPRGVALSPDGRYAYVANRLTGAVAEIDLTANPPAPARYIDLGSDCSPESLATTPDGRRVWVSCWGGPAIIDVTTTPPTVRRVDLPDWLGQVTFSADGRRAWLTDMSSHGTSVTVVDVATLATMSLPVGYGTRSAAFGPSGRYLYVTSDYTAGSVFVIDTLSGEVSTRPGWGDSLGIAALPDATLRLATTVLPEGRAYDGYAFSVVAAGGTPPYRASRIGGALPDGLTIDTAGLVAGVPTRVQTSTFTVSVTDSSDPPQATTGTVTLSVFAGRPPVASFTQSPESPVVGQSVVFDASASHDSDTADRIVSYEWIFGDQTTVTVTDSPTTSHVYQSEGSYPVTLRLTDLSGLVSETTREVVVRFNNPPAVWFEPSLSTTVVGLPLHFWVWECRDPEDGLVTSYEWDFGDGTAVVRGTGNPSDISHIYPAAGPFVAVLRVYDSGGLSNEARAAIDVVANGVPTASIAASSLTSLAGFPVTFDAGNSTDPNFAQGDYLTFSWDFGDGQPASADSWVQHTYVTSGTYHVALTVRDRLAVTAQATVSIVVAANGAPVAAFATTPLSPVTAGPTVFDASASNDPDVAAGDSIVSWAWTFGDGSAPASGVRVTRAFSAPGSYRVTLVVTDRGGNQGTREESIDVRFGLANTSLPDALVGEPYEHRLVAVGASSWAVADSASFQANVGVAGTACQGLHLDAGTGFLAGSPVVQGACGPLVVTVTGADQSAQREYSIAVHAPGAYVAVNGSNSSPGFLAAIDLATLAASTTAGLAAAPALMVVSPDGRRAYATLPGPVNYDLSNPRIGSGRTVAVIDTATGAVIDTIDVQGIPLSLALSPDGNTLYLTQPADGVVAAVQIATGEVTRAPVGWMPIAVVPSLDGRRLFVTANGGVQVLDAARLEVISEFRLSDEYDSQGAWLVQHPAGHRLYAAANAGPGRWQIVEIDAAAENPAPVLRSLDVWTGTLSGLSIGPDGRWLLLPGSDGLRVVDVDAFTVENVSLGAQVRGAAAAHDGSTAYVTTGDGHLRTVDLQPLTVEESSVALGVNPVGIAVRPNPSFRVVTDPLRGAITNQPYQNAVVAAGGVPPYRCSSPELPSWLVLSPSCVLTGTPSAAGNLDVAITVSDSDVPSQLRTKTYTLAIGANEPPVAAFTIDPSPAVARQAVSFDASRSQDPDTAAGDRIVSYSWNFGDGTTGTGRTVTHVYDPAPAPLAVELVVSDRGGLSGSSTQVLSVLPSMPPVARIDPTQTTAFTGNNIFFSAGDPWSDRGSYDADGMIVNCHWDFGDATGADGWDVLHAYSTAGSRAVTLTVTDDSGMTATATVTILVRENHAPTAAFLVIPASPVAGLPVVLESNSTDPDAGDAIASCAWSLSGGEPFSSGCRVEGFVFPAPGTYEVNLQVTDAGGLSNTIVQEVVVPANQPPVAQFGVTPPAPVALERVVLDGRLTIDPNTTGGDRIVEYAWDLDADGTFERTGAVVTTSFPASGSYTVRLRVTDLGGNTSTATATVVIGFGIANTTLPDAFVGRPYQQSLAAVGASAWTIAGDQWAGGAGKPGTACEGLSLDPTAGAIAGQPIQVGNCGPFTLLVTAAESVGARSMTLRVVAPDVYVAVNDSSRLAIVDAAAGAVSQHDVLPAPSMIATSPDGRRLYLTVSGDVNLASVPPGFGDSPTVLVLDADTRGEIGRLTLPGVPTGLALSPDGARLYVSHTEGLSAFDTATLQLAGSAWLQMQTGVAMSPDGRWVYAPSGSQLYTLDAATLGVANELSLQTAGLGLWVAAHPAGHRVYVAVGGLGPGQVVEVDSASAPMLARLRVVDAGGSFAYGLTVTPDGSGLFLPTAQGLTGLDTATLTPRTVGVDSPRETAFAPDGTLAYVTTAAGTLVTLSMPDLQPVGQAVAVGADPIGVATRPDAAFRLLTRALPAGGSGRAYLAAAVAAGGVAPYRFSATGLPAGLAMSAAGLVEGIPSEDGTSSVVVTAADADLPGHSVTRTIELTIASNRAPVASLSIAPDPARFGSSVTFDASASADPDAGDRIVSYTWDFGDGTPPQSGPEPFASRVFWPSQPGQDSLTVTVTLTVTDSSGASSITTRQLQVFDNLRPVVAFVASLNPIVVNGTVNFSAAQREGGGSYDPDGWIQAYWWDFGDDTQSAGPAVTHVYAQPGIYTVTLTVTDDRGASASASTGVTVLADTPPTAVIFVGPNPVLAGRSVTLDSGSFDVDPGDNVTSCIWDFVDATGPQQVPSCSVGDVVFTTPGIHVVTLTVRDRSGASATTTLPVVVQVNEPPVARFTASPATPVALERVVLDASSSTDPNADAGDAITRYQWDLDNDGVFERAGTEPVIATTFPVPGSHTVTLRVTDSADNVSTWSQEIVARFGIANAALPDALVGRPYGQMVLAAGGEGWAVIEGSWTANTGTALTPCEGLALNPVTGALTGVPVRPGTCGPFTVRATSGIVTEVRELTLNVVPAEVYVAANNGPAVGAVSLDAFTTDWIAAPPGPVSMAPSADGRRLFVTLPGDVDVSAFPWVFANNRELLVVDVATRQSLNRIPLENVPTALALSPDGQMLYVSDVSGLSVIAVATLQVVRTLPSSPALGVTTSPDGRWVYLAGEYRLLVLDAKTLEFAAEAPLESDAMALWVAAHPAGHRVYAVLGNSGQTRVLEFELGAGGAPELIPRGDVRVANSRPLGLMISPDGSRLFVPTVDGGLIVLDTGTLTVHVLSQCAARAVAFSPDGKRAFVTTASELVTLDVATLASVGGALATGSDLVGVAVRPDTTLRVITGALPDTMLNQPYAVPLVAAGGVRPYRFSATGLPDGLVLSQEGWVTGSATRTGAFLPAITLTGADPRDGRTTLVFPMRVSGSALPVAAADTYTAFANTPLTVGRPGVLGNDTDPDDSYLTTVLGIPPAHGSLELRLDGSFAYTPAWDYVGSDSFTYGASDGHSESAMASVSITVLRAIPVLTWGAPAPIVYGARLDAAQLNAVASVDGTFIYDPPAGTLLGGGPQTLSVSFRPVNEAVYTAAEASVTITVQQATPTLTWTVPDAIVHGTPLGDTQLNATASATGTFTYSPAAGTILATGVHTLHAMFTPSEPASYTTASTSVSIEVRRATPAITWPPPSGIAVGAVLTTKQLNATANVAGAFVYSPPEGSVLDVGTQVLSVTFTPTDAANYTTATASVTIDVRPLEFVFTGFINPIDNPPTVNTSKAGQKINIKWRLTDFAGVSIPDPASVDGITSYPVACASLTGNPADEVEEYAESGTGLEYVGSGTWRFVWQTPKSYRGTCRVLVVILEDRSAHTALFSFR